MHPTPAARRSRLGLVLMALGALVFLSSGALLVVLFLAARAPGLDTLSQVSGRVKSMEMIGAPQSERELRIVIEQAGSLVAGATLFAAGRIRWKRATVQG